MENEVLELEFVSYDVDNDSLSYDYYISAGYGYAEISENTISIEVHIFNYCKFDLYSQFIEIEFVDYVRNERKFKNKEELKLQLTKDKEYCKSLQF